MERPDLLLHRRNGRVRSKALQALPNRLQPVQKGLHPPGLLGRRKSQRQVRLSPGRLRRRTASRFVSQPGRCEGEQETSASCFETATKAFGRLVGTESEAGARAFL